MPKGKGYSTGAQYGNGLGKGSLPSPLSGNGVPQRGSNKGDPNGPGRTPLSRRKTPRQKKSPYTVRIER